MATLNIDIDLDDILFEDDYIPKKLEKQIDEYYNKSINECEFISNLLKIKDNYINLNNEEIELINKIGGRL